MGLKLFFFFYDKSSHQQLYFQSFNQPFNIFQFNYFLLEIWFRALETLEMNKITNSRFDFKRWKRIISVLRYGSETNLGPQSRLFFVLFVYLRLFRCLKIPQFTLPTRYLYYYTLESIQFLKTFALKGIDSRSVTKQNIKYHQKSLVTDLVTVRSEKKMNNGSINLNENNNHSF